MKLCDACSKNSLMPEYIGEIVLCKKCALKLHVPAWKNKQYFSNEEVEAEKRKVIDRAMAINCYPYMIEKLENHFESKKIAGLVKIFNGGEQQLLTVCDNYCVIETGDCFEHQKIQRAYNKMNLSTKRGNQPLVDECGWSEKEIEMLEYMAEDSNSNMFTEILGGLAGGFIGGIGGRVAKGVAGSVEKAIFNAGKAAKNKNTAVYSRPITFNIRSGAHRINYIDYKRVVYMEPVGKEEYGFIRFESLKNPQDDALFFFSCAPETKREAGRLYDIIRKDLENVQDGLEELRKSRQEIKQEKSVQPEVKPEETKQTVSTGAPVTFVADELLKFKQLLDMGAITQEEFDAKKKQLLGL